MQGRDTRIWTLIVGCFSLASVVSFLIVYAPEAFAATPGTRFRAMAPVPLLAAVWAVWGWLPGLVIGTRQLFWRPRVYGLISIALSALQFACFRLAQWLLMDLRGITWGS